MRNLNSKITRLDEDALKQQEVLYNQDFTIQQLERRIGRMQVQCASIRFTSSSFSMNCTQVSCTLMCVYLLTTGRAVRRGESAPAGAH